MTHPYTLRDAADTPTPALVFYPELIAHNVAAVVAAAGDPIRLRPHVKTHKTAEIVALQLQVGITKHKCATLAEAELLAAAGVAEVLVAYPLVGPNPQRLAALARRFPQTHFAATVESREAADALADAARAHAVTLGFFVDLNVGMDRTGIPLADAEALYAHAAALPNLSADGLHAYDGHNTHPDPVERHAAARVTLAPVLELRARLERRGFAVPRLVVGGTPAFPAYAAMRDIPGLECSPGTFALHDDGYGSRYPDLPDITPAAVLLTRVVSRPTPTRVTLDLGHKAVAADPPLERRVKLLGVPEYRVVMHSEEHLVIETDHAAAFAVGQVVYALPGHVCPTVALHDEALVAEAGRVVGRWRVARGRAVQP